MTRRLSLSALVAESLAERIRSGALEPGAQLPTEAGLCVEYDVSRTVVREAVMRLRSEGMIVSQQGRGMFVSSTSASRRFLISDEALKSLPETIALLELRLSVEVESAGMCAERRSSVDARTIRRTMEGIDAREDDPGAVQIHYDYDFHLAIARATRNEFVHGFLVYLRGIIVPRLRLGHIVADELKSAYYAHIHAEHEAIMIAVERKDGDAARSAMRIHLSNSLERVRALSLEAGVNGPEAEQVQKAKSLFAAFATSRAAGR